MRLLIKIVLYATIGVAIIFSARAYIDRLTYREPEIVRIPVYIERPPTEHTIVEKTSFREVFVQEIIEKQELITLEVELNEEIQLDDSWNNMDLFKKNQKIVFRGIGLYTTDLGVINSDSLLVDPERKIVQVKLNAPVPKSVTIDERATEYQSIENGILRTSNEIKLSTSEQQTLMVQIKTAMESRMHDTQLMEQARISARNSIISLFENILTEIDEGDYTVDVIFEY